MKADPILEVISSRRPEGAIVYSLTRKKRRSILVALVDEIVSGGALDTTMDIADAVSTRHVLVADGRHGTILGVRGDQVVEELPVPGWQSSWKQSFTKVDVGKDRYTKTARIDG